MSGHATTSNNQTKTQSLRLKDANINEGDSYTILWPVDLHIIAFINSFPFSFCTEILSVVERGKSIFSSQEEKKRCILKLRKKGVFKI